MVPDPDHRVHDFLLDELVDLRRVRDDKSRQSPANAFLGLETGRSMHDCFPLEELLDS